MQSGDERSVFRKGHHAGSPDTPIARSPPFLIRASGEAMANHRSTGHSVDRAIAPSAPAAACLTDMTGSRNSAMRAADAANTCISPRVVAAALRMDGCDERRASTSGFVAAGPIFRSIRRMSNSPPRSHRQNPSMRNGTAGAPMPTSSRCATSFTTPRRSSSRSTTAAIHGPVSSSRRCRIAWIVSVSSAASSTRRSVATSSRTGIVNHPIDTPLITLFRGSFRPARC